MSLDISDLNEEINDNTATNLHSIIENTADAEKAHCLVSISNDVVDNIYRYLFNYADEECLERYCGPGKPINKSNFKDLAGIAYEQFVRNEGSVIGLPGELDNAPFGAIAGKKYKSKQNRKPRRKKRAKGTTRKRKA